MSRKAVLVIIGLIVLLIVGSQTLFVVHQVETAVILQLGEPVDVVTEPGLKAKLPFIQQAVFLDKRLLGFEARTAGTYTFDKKAIVLDHYTRWRITDPLRFYQTVRNIATAQSRLENIVDSQLKAFIGRYILTDVVSGKRGEIITVVTKQASERAKDMGIEVIDVRIRRTDLPPQNQQAIFERMKTERERMAKQYRSEGEEEAAKINSAANREREILLATARQQASIIKGRGDAEATRIYAEAFSLNPEFYVFSRSLEAYRKALKDNTRILLPLDNPFLKYLQ